MPIYLVLQQKALLAIVQNRPATPEELGALPWVGERTVERFGKEILDIVADYVASGQSGQTH